MKRPLAVFGLTFLSALAVVSCFGINYTKYHTIAIIITAALFLLSFIVTRRGKGKALPVFFAAVTVSLILFSVKAAYVGRLTDGLAADTKQTVLAELSDLPYKSSGLWHYEMETVSINGENQKVRFLLISENHYDTEPFDRIEAKLKFGRETSAFSISDGIYLYSYTNDIPKIIRVNSSSPKAVLLKVRRTLLNAADELFNENESAFVRAVLLGDKTGLPAKLRLSFRAAGVSHMLVLSGMHMTFISFGFLWLFRKLIKNRRICNIAVILPITLFVLLAGSPPSLVRAAVSASAALIADSIFRDAEPLNFLGLAALIICLPNPFAAMNVGTLMSFSAAAAVILYAARINNFLTAELGLLSRHGFIPFILREVSSAVSVSAAASAAVLPFSLLLFNQLSVLTLPANVLLIPILPIAMALSAVSVLCFCITPVSFLAKPAAFLAKSVLNPFMETVNLIADVPFSSFYVRDFCSAVIVSAAICILMLIFSFDNYKPKLKAAVCILSLIIAVNTLVGVYVKNNYFTVEISPVGNGYTALVSGRNTKIMFYSSDSAYPTEKAVEVVEKSGHIDAFVNLSAAASDSVLYRRISDTGKVRNMFFCGEKASIDTDGGCGLEFINENSEIEAEENLKVELLTVNDNLWAVVTLNGEKVLIIPSNASKKDAEKFYENDPGEFFRIIANKNLLLPQSTADSADRIYAVSISDYSGLALLADKKIYFINN